MKGKNENLVRSIVMLLCFLFLSSQAQADLTLESAYPTFGLMNQNLDVTLTGEGFDENTKVSMYLDSGNRRAIIGSVDTPGYVNDVTVVGDRAYVTDRDSGLQVIDISNPQNLHIIGWEDTPGEADDVTVVGNRAYVADDYYGLCVIDVSNPQNPEILGSEDTLREAKSVTVDGVRAYVADGEKGLQVIDISNPANPVYHRFCGYAG